MKISIKEFLTFDDVLLLPHHGDDFKPELTSLKSKITKKISIEVPIIASGMPTVTESKMAKTLNNLGGVGIIHPFMKLSKYADEIKAVKKAGSIVGAAVGDGDWKRVETAYRAKADFITIDAANGDTKESLLFISKIKKKYPKIEIMAGCFATVEGVKRAIKAGADSIRVGIGPGSHCTTRIVAGVGVPQFSLLVETSKVTKKLNIPLISDGGIKNSGDCVKALAAGADAVMIGGLFAGTNESPGKIKISRFKKYKETWGYSSKRAQTFYLSNVKIGIKKRIKKIIGLEKQDKINYASEGVESKKIKYKGSVKPIIIQLTNGIKNGLAYTGSKNLQELKHNSKFIKITNAGLIESYPHGLDF